MNSAQENFESDGQAAGRDIPEGVKRQVRERCGYGCVICGAVPVDYDHWPVAYSECKSHDANNIILMCTGHHRKHTGRILDDKFIARAVEVRPQDRPARFHLDGTLPDFAIHWPGNTIDTDRSFIAVADQKILEIRPGQHPLAPVLLSAVFTDRAGREVCRIKDNELEVFTKGVGDFTVKADRFAFKDKFRRPFLKFRLNTSGLTVTDMLFCHRGVAVVGGRNRIRVVKDEQLFEVTDMRFANLGMDLRNIQQNPAIVVAPATKWQDFSDVDFWKLTPRSSMTMQGFTIVSTGGGSVFSI